ncbi:hypothetical protein NKJ10_17645 [Mesorhizobium sp. M0204]|uniref:hypothetical protein n=1 Tax=Mesorhizobium sp. M0204 TaxID=2956913 RepID=UPI00333BEAB2
MNNARRTAIAALADRIGEIKAELETLRDEENDYFDNMPESFQCGDKGQVAEAAVASMDDALSELEGAIDNLNSSTGG